MMTDLIGKGTEEEIVYRRNLVKGKSTKKRRSGERNK